MTALRLEWRRPIVLLILCLLFIPVRIYALPVSLPFEVDPYRLLLTTLIALWTLSLLSDPRVAVRASGLEGPIALFLISVLGSLVANSDRTSHLVPEVAKALSLLASVLLTFYLAVSLLRRMEDIESVLSALVLGGALLGLLAIIESRTGWSPFVHLDRYMPFLERIHPDELLARGGHFRAAGSAQHPIALGALLALLAPISVALAVRNKNLIWWIALGLLVLGAVSTVSRTAVVVLIASFGLFTALRWSEAKRFVPLGLVVLALVHLLVPGTLGTLRVGLHPSTLSVEQRSSADSTISAGRIADLGPSFEEFRARPLLGYGYGTRVVTGLDANARLLDDQWLGTLLDTGLIGLVALVWLFARFIGRLTRAGAAAVSSDGVLLAALASSAFGFAVGMFFYDAFSFTQVSLAFFLVLAAGCSLALAPGRIFDALPEPIVAPQRVKKTTLRSRLAARALRRREHVAEQMERVRGYSAGRGSSKDD